MLNAGVVCGCCWYLFFELSSLLDIFSVAQLPGEEQVTDLKNITEAVYGAAEMTVLVDPNGTCFTRIWCLFGKQN